MHGDLVKSVYCHWDGYLAHNGKILQEYYDSATANNLVALGDLSSLRPTIGVEHAFSHYDVEMDKEDYYKQFGDMCTFYGRDRGEENTAFKVAHTFAEFLEQCDNCGAEYYYIIKDGVWYCGTTYNVGHSLAKKLTALTEAIEAEEKETA
jgi:ribosomal protein L37AE/L43A